MTRDEALERNIRRLLASTAEPPIETEATDALSRRYAGS
jgi:hypothetical protein